MKTQNKPYISIVIPCFNQENYINQCLDSILSQKFKNFEIICVDDGSKDSTLKILKAYSNKDKRVKVFAQQNKSAGTARNLGVLKASGKYIFFMDSDDFLVEDALDIYESITKVEDADMYLNCFQIYDDVTGKTTEKKIFQKFTNSIKTTKGQVNYKVTNFLERKEAFMWSWVAPWNKLYKREFLIKNEIKFDEIFSTNDRTFYFWSITKAQKLLVMDAILINYRINNANSLTGDYNEDKFNNRKLAYYSTIKHLDLNDREICKSLFQTTVQDFVSFFKKTDKKNKFDVFLKTVDFFKLIDTSNVPFANENKFIFWYNLLINSDYLLKIDRKKVVPIVFATNDKYAPYLSSAIEGLKAHADKKRFYDIYVFHTSLDKQISYKLTSQSTENVHIRVLNVLSLTKDILMYTKSHYSVEMYYRILISDILYQYNKVLYLDCDISIQKDVAELYDIDIGDNIVGAINNPLGNKEMYNYVINILKLEEEKYFNSGVLLINIDRFKQENIMSNCFDLLKKYGKLACPDQDILNLSCYDKVKYLGTEWNFQTQSAVYSLEDKYEKKYNIIHYTTGNKPWNTEKLPLGEFFWADARQCPFYEDIIKTYLSSTLKLTNVKLVKEEKLEKIRNIINSKNQLHKNIINPIKYKKKLLITWPIRFLKTYNAIKKEQGVVSARRYAKDDLSYVARRISNKLNNFNVFKKIKEHKKEKNLSNSASVMNHKKETKPLQIRDKNKKKNIKK